MSSRDLLAEALKLPVAERGRIVAALLRSLEEKSEDEAPAAVDAAWCPELERRAAAAADGEATTTEFEAACDARHANIDRRR